MLSFWRIFCHWLHWKLSTWQLPVQPVTKISSKWWHARFNECQTRLFVWEPFGFARVSRLSIRCSDMPYEVLQRSQVYSAHICCVDWSKPESATCTLPYMAAQVTTGSLMLTLTAQLLGSLAISYQPNQNWRIINETLFESIGDQLKFEGHVCNSVTSLQPAVGLLMASTVQNWAYADTVLIKLEWCIPVGRALEESSWMNSLWRMDLDQHCFR